MITLSTKQRINEDDYMGLFLFDYYSHSNAKGIKYHYLMLGNYNN